MNPLRVCIIGLGAMGAKHLNVFATMPQAQVVGVCDLNRDLARKCAEEYGPGISAYDSVEEMLRELQPDAVAISVPDHAHKIPVLAALDAGAHVLVEKPLATTLADSDEMIRHAKACGKTLMVNYSHRWVPAYYLAHQKISSGELGKVAMVYAKKNDPYTIVTQWPWLKDSSPSAFLSSHDIDLTRWFVGSEVKSVYARGHKGVLKQRLGMDVYDCIQALAEFENGAVATFESSFIYPAAFPTLTDSHIQVSCEKGLVELPRQSECLHITTDESYELPKIGIAATIEGKIQGAFRLAGEHFVECVQTGKEPITSGWNSRQVSEIVEAIHRSLGTGEVIRLPLKG